MVRRNKEYVKKRKSYYGFARYYPGQTGSKSYAIGDSVSQKKRDTIRGIIIAILLVLLFVATFVITSVGYEISERPAKNAECRMQNYRAQARICKISTQVSNLCQHIGKPVEVQR